MSDHAVESEVIEFRPSKMPGMRRWKFELSATHLALRNMTAWLPVPPFLIRYAPDILVPLEQVQSAELDPDPIGSIRRFSSIKGRRLIPGVNLLVVCSLDQGRQFFAVRGGRAALALNLRDGGLTRLTVSFPEPERLLETINRAAAAGTLTAPQGSAPPNPGSPRPSRAI